MADAAGRRLPGPSVLGAFLEGWRRVVRAPWLVFGMLGLLYLAAAPLAGALRSVSASPSDSGLAPSAWWGVLLAMGVGAEGLSPNASLLIGPQILAFRDILGAPLGTSNPPSATLINAMATYILFTTFLAGGAIDRLARARPVGARAFFGACGAHLGRMLRLTMLLGCAYWVLFRWLRPLALPLGYGVLDASNTTVAARPAQALMLLAGLVAVHLVADFAKIRLVVEDRRSSLAALASAWRFVRRRPGRVAALYGINLLPPAVLGGLWSLSAASGVTPSGIAMAAGALYLLCRGAARLAFLASAIVFFQGELAHAGFTRAPRSLWPDSPAVEGIHNLRESR